MVVVLAGEFCAACSEATDIASTNEARRVRKDIPILRRKRAVLCYTETEQAAVWSGERPLETFGLAPALDIEESPQEVVFILDGWRGCPLVWGIGAAGG